MIVQSLDNMTTTDGRTILNTTELAERLSIGLTTASEYLRTGVIKNAKKDPTFGNWYVLEEDVMHYERAIEAKHTSRMTSVQELFQAVRKDGEASVYGGFPFQSIGTISYQKVPNYMKKIRK